MSEQGVGLSSKMLSYNPGYAAAGIIALIQPLFLAVLPVLSPVGTPCTLIHLYQLLL